MTMVFVALSAAAACPPEAQEVERALDAAKASLVAAREHLYGTDWDFRRAVDDPDDVEAARAHAEARVRDARAAFKQARDARKELRDELPPEELVCDPAEHDPLG
jgi:hypothetical protein